jgi:hypothetical protein
LEKLVQSFINRLPTGPISAHSVTKSKEGSFPPWTITGTSKRTVYLPKNLESLADCPLALAAFGACYVLKPEFAMSDEESEPHTYEKAQKAYLSGIAWALREGEGELAPYHSASGPMGHGFNWVCHKSLETLNAGTWWAKGTPWNPTKGLTGKAWSADLDATTRRVNSLLSRAAAELDATTNWASWFRAPESFLGKEIKKALPYEGSTIINEAEQRFLCSTYNQPIAAYKRLLSGLKAPDLPFVQGLAKHIKDVGISLRALNGTVDRTVSHRMAHVYPSNKKDRKFALRRPLTESINALSKEEYIFVFDPLILGGLRPFRIVATEEDQEIDWVDVRRAYESRLEGIKNAGMSALHSLSSQWADTYIGPMKQD